MLQRRSLTHRCGSGNGTRLRHATPHCPSRQCPLPLPPPHPHTALHCPNAQCTHRSTALHDHALWATLVAPHLYRQYTATWSDSCLSVASRHPPLANKTSRRSVRVQVRSESFATGAVLLPPSCSDAGSWYFSYPVSFLVCVHVHILQFSNTSVHFFAFLRFFWIGRILVHFFWLFAVLLRSVGEEDRSPLGSVGAVDAELGAESESLLQWCAVTLAVETLQCYSAVQFCAVLCCVPTMSPPCRPLPRPHTQLSLDITPVLLCVQVHPAPCIGSFCAYLRPCPRRPRR
jgi:hypothetical protein